MRWRATSSDGHTGSGVYTFGIGVDAAAADRGVRLDRADVDGRRRALGVLRRARRSSLGTLGLRLLVLREPLPERLSNRLYGVAAAGGIATLNVGIAAFVMRAADALQLPFVDLLYGDLSPIATKTRFGVAFVAMTLGYALVTALVLLAWILDRPRLLWPAFLVGLGFASGPVALGAPGRRAELDRSSPGSPTGCTSWRRSLWVGGLVALAFCVWPLAPQLRRTAFLGFSRLATVLVAVLVLAGTYLSIARLPAVADLWSTTLRPDAARQARDRLRRARLGRGAPLPRAAAARARRRAARPATQPARRERRRDRRAARWPPCSSTRGRRRWNRRAARRARASLPG